MLCVLEIIWICLQSSRFYLFVYLLILAGISLAIAHIMGTSLSVEDLSRITGPGPGSSSSFGGAPTSHGGALLDRDKAPIAQGVRVTPLSSSTSHISSPIGVPVSAANGEAHNLAASLPVSNGDSAACGEDSEALRSEVKLLRKEVLNSRDLIRKMKERETLLTDRLSEQALKQLEKGSTKFEDLNLGNNRPTQLIRRYGNLYNEIRLDTFDALEELPEIADFDDLKGKLLFSVVVLSFRSVQRSLLDTRQKVRQLLCLPAADSKGSFAKEPIVQELEGTISVYLRKFVERYDVSQNTDSPIHEVVKEVCAQVYSTLYDYPSLKQCDSLRQYIDESVRLAWALSVQNPPLHIDFSTKTFHEDLHQRFHTSNPESNKIKSMLWPCLREGENGPCVFKGVVVT